jgi:hypothetical protein
MLDSNLNVTLPKSLDQNGTLSQKTTTGTVGRNQTTSLGVGPTTPTFDESNNWIYRIYKFNLYSSEEEEDKGEEDKGEEDTVSFREDYYRRLNSNKKNTSFGVDRITYSRFHFKSISHRCPQCRNENNIIISK